MYAPLSKNLTLVSKNMFLPLGIGKYSPVPRGAAEKESVGDGGGPFYELITLRPRFDFVTFFATLQNPVG